MGSPYTAATSVVLLEPAGCMMRNYGARTPLVSLAAHVAYGTVVGGFVALSQELGVREALPRGHFLGRPRRRISARTTASLCSLSWAE
jgi:hypothetical protein